MNRIKETIAALANNSDHYVTLSNWVRVAYKLYKHVAKNNWHESVVSKEGAFSYADAEFSKTDNDREIGTYAKNIRELSVSMNKAAAKEGFKPAIPDIERISNEELVIMVCKYIKQNT